MSKKVINKGYTLEVVSWENDGDNYNTKKVTVKTKDEAEKLYRICTELFGSKNSRGIRGVGNSMDGEGTRSLIRYTEANPTLFPDLVDTSGKITVDDDEISDYFRDIAYSVMGGSEFYDFRVCQSCVVTYSPEDVYLELVTF